MTAKQEQAIFLAQLHDLALGQSRPLGRQVNHVGRVSRVQSLNGSHRLKDGRASHDHAGAASVRCIIDLTMFALTPVAQLMKVNLHQSSLLSPCGNTVLEGREHFGKKSEDIETHAKENRLRRPPQVVSSVSA